MEEDSSIANGSATLCSNYGNYCGSSSGIKEWLYLKIQLYRSSQLQLLLQWWNSRTKGTWGGKGLIQFTLPQQHCSPLQSGQELKQCVDLNAGVHAEARRVLLTDFSLHYLVCFLTKPRTTRSGVAPWPIRQNILHQLDLM